MFFCPNPSRLAAQNLPAPRRSKPLHALPLHNPCFAPGPLPPCRPPSTPQHPPLNAQMPPSSLALPHRSVPHSAHRTSQTHTPVHHSAHHPPQTVLAPGHAGPAHIYLFIHAWPSTSCSNTAAAPMPEAMHMDATPKRASCGAGWGGCAGACGEVLRVGTGRVSAVGWGGSHAGAVR